MNVGIDLGARSSVVAVAKDADSADPPQNDHDVAVSILPGFDGIGQWTPSLLCLRLETPPQPVYGWPAHAASLRGDPAFRLWSELTDMESVSDFADVHLPTEARCGFLAYLKESAERELGEPIREATLTYPAHFDTDQVETRRRVAESCGLGVGGTPALVTTPVAAAYAYLHQTPLDDALVMVFDLGATFDLAVVGWHDQQIGVRAIDGDRHIGGIAFTQRVVDFYRGRVFRDNPGTALDDARQEDRALRAQIEAAAEQLKIERFSEKHPRYGGDDGEEVMGRMQAMLGDEWIERVSREPRSGEAVALDALRLATAARKYEGFRGSFEELVLEDDLRKAIAICERCLEKAGVRGDDLDRILLAGGSSRIPAVADSLREAFAIPLYCNAPMFLAAKGAALIPRSQTLGSGGERE